MKAMLLIIVLLLLVSVGFAQELAVTKEKAETVVSDYVLTAETINMQPAETVFTSGAQFWVFEITKGDVIQVMMPVNGETGYLEVEGDQVKEAIKIHYLANYFETTQQIEEFLATTLASTRTKQSSLQSKKDSYASQLQPTIPENITFTNEADYLTSLQNAADAASELGEAAKATSTAISASEIRDLEDIDAVQTAFGRFYSKYNFYLTMLETLKGNTVAFDKEINEKGASGELDSQTATILSLTIKLDWLDQEILTKGDEVDSSQAQIQTQLFDKLDERTNEYYLKLKDRTESGLEEIARKATLDEITTLLANHTTLYNLTTDLPPYYIEDNSIDTTFEETYDTLTTANTECQKGIDECNAIKTSLDDVKTQLHDLQVLIEDYEPIECSSGKGEVNGECVCTGGRTENSVGECVLPEEDTRTSQNTTLYLIIGAIAIIVLLFVFKDKIFGGKKNDEMEFGSESAMFGFGDQ